MTPFHLAFPFRLRNGVEAHVDRAVHVEQLIEAILFTGKGERVNQPAFGCGVQRLVFMATDGALVSATLFVVKSELQRYVAGEAVIQDVSVAVEGETLFIDVRYALADAPHTRLVRFAQEPPR